MPRLSIRSKLLFSILFILLISYAALIYTTIRSYDSFISTESSRELDEHLTYAQKQYYARAEQMRYSLMQPASAPPVQGWVKGHDSIRLKDAVQRWTQILPFAEVMTVVDRDNTVIARLKSDLRGDKSPYGPLLEQAFRRKQPVVSTELVSSNDLCREGVKTYCRSDGTEAMAIVVVVPIADVAGDYVGGIVAADVINDDPFLPFQIREIFGKKTELAITQGGVRIASSVKIEAGVPATLPPHIVAVLAAGELYRGETGSGDSTYLTVFKPITNIQGDFIGSLSVALSQENLKQIRRESERNIFMSAAFGIILAVTISYLAARRLIAPLNILSSGVKRIEEGDLSQRVSVTGNDEFGALAESFNRMAEALAERDRTITKKTGDLEELNLLLTGLNELLEKKVSERTNELRLEMGMLEAILTSMAEGVVVTDKEDKIILFNPAAQKIFDLIPHRVLNQPIGQVCEHCGFPLLLQYIEEIKREAGFTTVNEKDMSVRGKRLRVNLAPLVEDKGAFAGVVMSIRDVTAEEEVDRMKTEFISTVSHELKTPLTSIKGALQYIFSKAKWLTNTEQELLSVCLRNTERLIRLINDILDVSKIESGRLEFHLKPRSVSELAIYAIEEMKGFAMSRNVTIVNSVGDHLPLVYCDYDRMIQVLTNLLSNAVKFSPEGKVIMVSGEQHDRYVAVSVADHGKEIQWSDREKLFKKFQQLDNVDAERQGGTGLGLAICKEIIERHHGKIFYHSGTTGGNVFTFTLPIYEEQ